ncbi:MAG: hypothetical protein ACJ78Q_18800 [Chloroflexia bacterium]
MSQQSSELQEAQLRRVASAFVYPPTPDIASAVLGRLEGKQVRASRPGPTGGAHRRLAWAALAAMLALLLAGTMAVPEIRAAVQAFLRIGSIEVVVATPTPAGSALTPTPWPAGGISAYSGMEPGGSTTLEEAQAQMYFPIRLPAYPGDLGKPDKVFVQDLDGDLVVLMWPQPGVPDKPRIVLFEMTSEMMGRKNLGDRATVQETHVHGQQALWVRGAHTLNLYDNAGNTILERQLDDANVLIWTEGDITYRLETRLALEEAIKVAESLVAAPITPVATPTPLSVLDVAGATTLETARNEVRFLELPAYPPDLGKPDKVFLQDLGDEALILAWTQPGHPAQVRLALYELVSANIGERTAQKTTVLQETRVAGNYARWARGPHLLAFKDINRVKLRAAKLVDGNALLWAKGAITYRLETTLPLEEAVKIAESIP